MWHVYGVSVKLRNRLLADRAFNLVELLVAIAVMGILAAVTLPSFLTGPQKANDSVAQNNARIAYGSAKSAWGYDGADSFTVAQLMARLSSNQDASLTAQPWVSANPPASRGDSSGPSNVSVSVEDGGQQVTLCTKSKSGSVFCLRANQQARLQTASAGGGGGLLGAFSGPDEAQAVEAVAFSKGSNEPLARCVLPSATSALPSISACQTSYGGSAAQSWGAGTRTEMPPPPPPGAPVSVTPGPSISGQAVATKSLDAAPGTWTPAGASYAYQWQRCDATGLNCVNVAGATTAAYTLQNADINSTVRVVVSASNGVGSSRATSAATQVVVAGGPRAASVPSINGATIRNGYTLTAGDGTWQNAASLSRQWLRCDASGNACTPINAATAATYMMTQADIGKTIRLSVTATDSSGAQNTERSVQTPIVTQTPDQTVGVPAFGVSIGFGCCADQGAYYTDAYAGGATNIWGFNFAGVPAGWNVVAMRAYSYAGNSGYPSQTHTLYNGATTLASLGIPAGAGQDCTYGCGWGNFVNYLADSGMVNLAGPLTPAQAQAQIRLYQTSNVGLRSFAQVPVGYAVVRAP